MNQLVWIKKLPTKTGWYWRRGKGEGFGDPACIVEIRDYVGELAIMNTFLSRYENEDYDWAGPIPQPSERNSA